MNMDWKTLGWGSEESQKKRLRILASIVDGSVLDVGCGFGDLIEFLPDVDYSGIESGFDIAEEGQRRHGNIIQWGMFPGMALNKDYVLSSGLFTYYDEKRVKDLIRQMYKKCNKATGFNCLLKCDDGEYAYDPQVISDYCRTLSDSVKVVMDYLPNDFTVFMYR